MTHEIITRAVVWSVLAGCIGYDVLCVVFGWPTISHVVRELDHQCAGLIRWGWLALWLHFFVRAWQVPNGL